MQNAPGSGVDVVVMIRDGYCKARVLEEIVKCDVLCANCHLNLHWGEN